MSEAPNPFEPPKDWSRDEAPAADLDEWVDASQGARFTNNLVDSGLQWGLGTALMSVIGENIAASLLFTLAYYAAFETLFGRTPAKWLTRTRVVTIGGMRPGFGQIVKRTLVRFVPFEAFSFLGNPPRGWHDRWSNTRVVRDGGMTGRWRPGGPRSKNSRLEFE